MRRGSMVNRRLIADVRKRGELHVLVGHADGRQVTLGSVPWGLLPDAHDMVNWNPHEFENPVTGFVYVKAVTEAEASQLCWRMIPSLQIGATQNPQDPTEVDGYTGYRIGQRIQVREMRMRFMLDVSGIDTVVTVVFLKKRVGDSGTLPLDYQPAHYGDFVQEVTYPNTGFMKRENQSFRRNVKILKVMRFKKSRRLTETQITNGGTNGTLTESRYRVSVGKTFKPGYRPIVRFVKVADESQDPLRSDKYRPAGWEYYCMVWANQNTASGRGTIHETTAKFSYYDS